jgi:hypothetical protein
VSRALDNAKGNGSRAAPQSSQDVWHGVSSARVGSHREKTKQTVLSDYVETWLRRYAEVGKRGDFLWKWCFWNVKLVTLPCASPAYVAHLADTKMVHLVFLCLIDDIVDELHDRRMFQAAMEITQSRGPVDLSEFDAEQRRYLELLGESWKELWTRAEAYPRYREFEDDLRFDYAQVIQALWHSLRVNTMPARINVYENDVYQPHNMAMVFMAMLDLCASPSFEAHELGLAREVFLHAQMMGRIGNTLATWERELASQDFASGIFAHAVDLGVLARDGLSTHTEAEIASSLRSPAVETRLMKVWAVHREKMMRKIEGVCSVDLSSYLLACDELVATHMSGRGLM